MHGLGIGCPCDRARTLRPDVWSEEEHKNRLPRWQQVTEGARGRIVLVPRRPCCQIAADVVVARATGVPKFVARDDVASACTDLGTVSGSCSAALSVQRRRVISSQES